MNLDVFSWIFKCYINLFGDKLWSALSWCHVALFGWRPRVHPAARGSLINFPLFLMTLFRGQDRFHKFLRCSWIADASVVGKLLLNRLLWPLVLLSILFEVRHGLNLRCKNLSSESVCQVIIIILIGVLIRHNLHILNLGLHIILSLTSNTIVILLKRINWDNRVRYNRKSVIHLSARGHYRFWTFFSSYYCIILRVQILGIVNILHVNSFKLWLCLVDVILSWEVGLFVE